MATTLLCYLPIGGPVMLLCQFVVSVPCTLVVIGLLATSARRRRRVRYWIALYTSAQPIPVALFLRRIGQFSPDFSPIWLVSMGALLGGLVALVAWPDKDPR